MKTSLENKKARSYWDETQKTQNKRHTAAVRTCTMSEQASWGPPAGNLAAPGSHHQCKKAVSSRQQTSVSASAPAKEGKHTAVSPLKKARLKIQQWIYICSLVKVYPHFPSQHLCLQFRKPLHSVMFCLLSSGSDDHGCESPQECSKLYIMHTRWNKLHFLFCPLGFLPLSLSLSSTISASCRFSLFPGVLFFHPTDIKTLHFCSSFF